MDPHSPRRASNISLAWAGVAFFVLYVAGALMATASPSNADDVNDNATDLAATWRHFYDDSGHRWTIIIGAFLLAAASLAIVVFASELRQRLADGGAPTAGRLAFAASVLFGALTTAGALAMAWIPGAKQFGSSALPDGSLNYMASQLGFGLFLLGGGASAAMLLVTSGYAGAATRVLPSWLGWAGVVIGVLLFFLAVLFIPMAVLALWVLVTAIVMLRRPSAATV